MCQTALHPFLEVLPKCEHHMHIEGSLEPELLFELAAKNGIALPLAGGGPGLRALRKRYEAFTGLDDFLGYYYVAMSALVDASDFERLAEAYFRRAARQNVRHAEVSFDPQAHSARGVALSTVIEGLTAARERAKRELGISSVLIMCVLRHLPPAEGVALFEEARDAGYFGGSVSDGKNDDKEKEPVLGGIGLDSSEKPFPPELWTELYGAAKKAGVRRTAHAGEEGPAQYIVDSLDMMDAQRIDHGLRSVLAGDEGVTDALLARLVDQKVMLTLCPLSNVRLRCLESVQDFPLRQLLDRGVRFSINSDDPAYFGGYILENYCALQEAFGLSVREWEGIAKGAVMGSWCADRRKWEILSEIEAVAGEWSVELGEQ
ncbi:Adenine deaminase [Apiospora phragmitis]|uniref:Adenine deaminase n=1 Tax=Apiospora phragmitis TaxID=2905665 RepID=A0ABR1WU22_9PEZI